MRNTLLIGVLLLFPLLAAAGEAGPIPPAELQALDRAISRELGSGQLGSQTLGDLTRLKNRLAKMRGGAKGDTAPAPTDAAGSERDQLLRLETEAKTGGKAAKRSLALYLLFLNEPEKALTQWRQAGKTSDFDVSHLLIASYLEFALGEYNNGRRNLEAAIRLIDSRSSLEVSRPVFCQTIAGYRVYTARADSDLLPGEEVLIYVEVEGADFKTVAEGSECRVMFGLKLKNDDQSTLWAEPNYGEYAPVFAGPIRDLHAALTWRVPNDLASGRYHLFVEALEDSTKRRGENVLAFSVGKRETNPDRRPTGGMAPRLPNQTLIDAQKAFPGATPVFPEPPRLRDENYYKQFDLLQQYERNQRVEK